MSGFRNPETLSAHQNLQIFFILIFKQTYWPFFFLSKMMHLLPNRIRRETRHKARFEVKNKKLLCLKMADRGSNKCLGNETRVANKPDKLLAILQKVTSLRRANRIPRERIDRCNELILRRFRNEIGKRPSHTFS